MTLSLLTITIALFIFIVAIISRVIPEKYYKWTLQDPIEIKLPRKLIREEGGHFYLKHNGKIWGDIYENKLVIRKGYSWDGCSPKIKLLGMVLGTWDGLKVTQILNFSIPDAFGVKDFFSVHSFEQQMYIPSLVHDILCQFSKDLETNGITDQHNIDIIFYQLAKENHFKFAKLYYKIVRFYQKNKS